MKKVNVTKHYLVPTHTKLDGKEKEQLFKKYNISLHRLPRISKHDAAIRDLNVKEGDVIKIVRQSPTSGVAIFYRGVVDVRV